MAAVGVLLQLTAGLAAAAQVVVCRTPGGHVAIESELSDCCLGGDPLHELSSSACDGCVDTPLIQAGLSPAGKTALGPAPASRWSAPVQAGTPVAGRLLALQTGAPPPGRTVVLLI